MARVRQSAAVESPTPSDEHKQLVALNIVLQVKADVTRHKRPRRRVRS